MKQKADHYLAILEKGILRLRLVDSSPARISQLDLLSLDHHELVRRTGINLLQLKDYIASLIESLQPKSQTALQLHQSTGFVSSGNEKIDELLGGGIRIGEITEFTGEAASGKSTLAVTTLLTVQSTASPESIYVSTESGLSTTRIYQIAKRLGIPSSNPGDKIHCILCPDLEVQDHIIRYQLPVLLSRQKIGLIVLDSVTANYRIEYTERSKMSQRSRELEILADTLRRYAQEYKLAVVVTNQVADKIGTEDDDIWSLDYQNRWLTGQTGKVPALGFVWSNCIDCRIVLSRYEEERLLNMVLCNRTAGGSIKIRIEEGGVVDGDEEEAAV
ncbi:DNA repair protein rhp57 [Neolecta irregularis DAH-3]|uniref:DNA repair protein rhp57 n=1 Tax=Neolecta irregularis (strain DAH-3) TaxID=1198029 RepID=A0A1U7LTR5_NEOID|nr:DNA repair protein rhp57 [Neolecta irregularis DAH-3]|eukprot:OLL26060.1 DNA repair protein rhp57 [Neolecta irregularis DAH-3]